MKKTVHCFLILFHREKPSCHGTVGSVGLVASNVFFPKFVKLVSWTIGLYQIRQEVRGGSRKI